jgi:hypothetical protein
VPVRLQLAALASIVLLGACGDGSRVSIDSRFAVSGPIHVVIEADEATVMLAPSVEGAVIVTGSIDPDRYSYDAAFDGRIVRIELLRERSLLALVQSGTAEVRARVPPGSSYEIVASATGVTVEAGEFASGSIETSKAAVVVRGGDYSLQVRNRNASVSISGQHGPLDVVTTSAAVDVVGHSGGLVAITTNDAPIEYTGTVEAGGAIELTTTNAHIVVRVVGDASFTIDAATTNGSISSRYAIIDLERTPTELRGRIASGDGSLQLRTTNGSIEVLSASFP